MRGFRTGEPAGQILRELHPEDSVERAVWCQYMGEPPEDQGKGVGSRAVDREQASFRHTTVGRWRESPGGHRSDSPRPHDQRVLIG